MPRHRDLCSCAKLGANEKRLRPPFPRGGESPPHLGMLPFRSSEKPSLETITFILHSIHLKLASVTAIKRATKIIEYIFKTGRCGDCNFFSWDCREIAEEKRRHRARGSRRIDGRMPRPRPSVSGVSLCPPPRPPQPSCERMQPDGEPDLTESPGRAPRTQV